MDDFREPSKIKNMHIVHSRLSSLPCLPIQSIFTINIKKKVNVKIWGKKPNQHDERCDIFVSGKYLKHTIYNHVQCTFYVKSYLNIESKHGFPIYDHTCTIICSRKTFLSNFVNQRKVYRESVTFNKE